MILVSNIYLDTYHFSTICACLLSTLAHYVKTAAHDVVMEPLHLLLVPLLPLPPLLPSMVPQLLVPLLPSPLLPMVLQLPLPLLPLLLLMPGPQLCSPILAMMQGVCTSNNWGKATGGGVVCSKGAAACHICCAPGWGGNPMCVPNQIEFPPL